DKGARLYGHIVVDEAQGMTAMQWRALSRRCPSGSFTIVGDLGQASTRAAPESWEQALEEVRTRALVRTTELTVNYRTPSEVMELAARVLAEAAPALTPPRSVRESGFDPVIERAEPDNLDSSVVAATRSEREALGDGKIAVIVPEDEIARLAELLAAPSAGERSLTTPEARALLDAPLSVLGLDAARGLEFDSVILVEPSRLVAEHAQGLRALYVALTRTTRRLRIVYSRDLPQSLTPAPSAAEAGKAQPAE
ncbi:MAG: ATP-binding domain-containing protein, partial [Acidimicrobiales bacterium]